jgi:hypothetical protein
MSPTGLVTTAIALLAQVTSAFVPPTTIETAQWSTYEMTLTATDTYDSYASVDLTGVFNGPDGRALEIKGFWDGGSTFRIRFTPTAEGLWTFMTVSDDPGLDGRLGNIKVVKAPQGAHGFVRQAADASPRWQYDDDTVAANELTAFPILISISRDCVRSIAASRRPALPGGLAASCCSAGATCRPRTSRRPGCINTSST